MHTAPADPEAIDVSSQWQQAAGAVLAATGVVLVVGGPDSGKSTFCRYVLEQAMLRRQALAFLDADLGQSQVGPPTTLGVKLYPSHAADDLGLSADAVYFIGQTSPLGRFLEVVMGLQRLVAAVRRRRRLILVNTSGYVSGPGAVRLKTAKAEVLAPQIGILLSRQEELGSLLTPLSLLCKQTYLLSTSPQARLKSWEERRRHRQLRFAAVFAKARIQSFPLGRSGWLGFPWVQGVPLAPPEQDRLQEIAGTIVWRAERGGGWVYVVVAEPLTEAAHTEMVAQVAPDRLFWVPWAHLESRLVGLLDKDMLTLALGILQAPNWQGGEIAILTPLPPRWVPRVRFLRLGRLRLDAAGQELPPL